MKLPEDRKDRIKVLALIAVGVIAVLYGTFVGVVLPTARAKKERRSRIEELEGKLEVARTAIRQMATDRTADAETLAGIAEAALQRKVVLRDRLGNYLLGASELLENHARRCGLVLDSVSEVGISQIPQASADAVPNLQAYTVRVALQCGLHELLRLFSKIETENPYLCISSLSIASQPEKPDRHAVIFDVQWPIWCDPDLPDKIAGALQQLSAPEEAAASEEGTQT